jgi:hypothetical protein
VDLTEECLDDVAVSLVQRGVKECFFDHLQGFREIILVTSMNEYMFEGKSLGFRAQISTLSSPSRLKGYPHRHHIAEKEPLGLRKLTFMYIYINSCQSQASSSLCQWKTKE